MVNLKDKMLMKRLTLIAAVLWSAVLGAWAQDADIPDNDKVGAGACPAEIAPLGRLPFRMGTVARPNIPDRKVTVGKPDAKGMLTKAVNSAIRSMARKGGGTVVVPAGHWKTGRITLLSGVCLHLEKGCELEFSGDIMDYQPAVFTRHEGVEVMGAGAFIYANGQHDIALSGEGVVMGPPMDSPMRKLRNGNSVVENDIDPQMPVEKRLCDGLQGRTFYRPKSFSPINCENVLVEGVTFERSVLWNINPVYCRNVIIRGVTVNSKDTPSGDGIDISSCKDVLIEYSTLNCGDDCFTLKSGRCEDGLRVGKPTENVLIRYCLSKDGHGGVTCGSETAGGIFNVYMHDCVFDGTRTGLRFKTRRNRGGGTWNVVFERIRMKNMNEAFTWDLLGSAQFMGDLARRYPPLDITPLTPTVRDITIRNFIVESTDRMFSVNAIPEIPLCGVVIENGTVRTNRLFKTLNDAESFLLRDLRISMTEPYSAADKSNLTMTNVTLRFEEKK